MQPAHMPTGLDYDIVGLKSNPTQNDEGPAKPRTAQVELRYHPIALADPGGHDRSEEHTSELQSL